MFEHNHKKEKEEKKNTKEKIHPIVAASFWQRHSNQFRISLFCTSRKLTKAAQKLLTLTFLNFVWSFSFIIRKFASKVERCLEIVLASLT